MSNFYDFEKKEICPICPKHFVPMDTTGYSDITDQYYWICTVDGCENGIVQGHSSRVLNLRMWVHALFDNIWAHDVWKGKMSTAHNRRVWAYFWLGEKMDKQDYHISHMKLRECWKAIEVVRNANLKEVFPTAKLASLKRIKSKIENCYTRAKDLNAFEIDNVQYEYENSWEFVGEYEPEYAVENF